MPYFPELKLPCSDLKFHRRMFARAQMIIGQHCFKWSLQWRHNGHDSVSNHQPHDGLLNPSFRSRSKKTSKLCVTGLCEGNSPVTGELPAQMASNAENVSIWWRHHDGLAPRTGVKPLPEPMLIQSTHLYMQHLESMSQQTIYEVIIQFSFYFLFSFSKILCDPLHSIIPIRS